MQKFADFYLCITLMKQIRSSFAWLRSWFFYCLLWNFFTFFLLYFSLSPSLSRQNSITCHAMTSQLFQLMFKMYVVGFMFNIVFCVCCCCCWWIWPSSTCHKFVPFSNEKCPVCGNEWHGRIAFKLNFIDLRDKNGETKKSLAFD